MEQKGTVHTEKPAKKTRSCRLHQVFDKETGLVNDQLCSQEAVVQHIERKERERKSFSKRGRRFKALAVQLEEDSKEKSFAKDTKYIVPYVMCGKIQDFEQCKTYLTKSVDEKSKYLSMKKLCYGCLKPISKTHTARNCNQCRICKICNKKYSASLHGFKLEKKTKEGAANDTLDQSDTLQDEVLKSNFTICDENIVCASTKNNAQVVSMCVVPVVTMHKDSAKEIITHAILDSCSQGTFIVEDLVNTLEINGIDTHLSSVKWSDPEHFLESEGKFFCPFHVPFFYIFLTSKITDET